MIQRLSVRLLFSGALHNCSLIAELLEVGLQNAVGAPLGADLPMLWGPEMSVPNSAETYGILAFLQKREELRSEDLFIALQTRSWLLSRHEEMLGDGYAAAERIALEPNGNPNYLIDPNNATFFHMMFFL
eukprot:s4860_g2.t1